jgi:cytochrome P450
MTPHYVNGWLSDVSSEPLIDQNELEPELAAMARQFHTTNPASMGSDGYAAMTALRTRCPAFRSERHGGYYVFLKYADQRAILRDADTFSSVTTMIPPYPGGGFGPPVEADPPNHTLYRRALDSYFTTARMEAKRNELHERARTLLGEFVGAGGGEIIEAFCSPLPTVTFMLMAGLPTEDLPQVQYWMDYLLAAGADPERRTHAEEVITPAVNAYCERHLNLREAMSDPPDDFLTGITRARLGDEPWSRADQVLCMKQLLQGGLDTVKQTLALSLMFLAENSAHRRQIVADPTLIPQAVEEFLRYFTIETTVRTATRDVEIAGITLRAGDRILLPLASAGRDESVFADPEVVNFARSSKQHLAFGVGPHRCMGSHVARIELRIALEEVVAYMPDFGLTPGTRPTRRWGTVFGLDQLYLQVK